MANNGSDVQKSDIKVYSAAVDPAMNVESPKNERKEL